MRIFITILFSFLGFATSWAQPSNDECINAIPLDDVTNWCSPPAAFTTAGATVSPQANPFCFPPAQSGDVWFSFVAEATDVNITMIGQTPASPGGTLESPQFALYSGNCINLNEIACASDAFNDNIIESFAGPLIVGETYYIRVDARNGNLGSFELCVNNFNEVPEPDSDCPTGVVLCDKSSFTVENLLGDGILTNEIEPSACIGQEFSSAWYKWTCDDPGTLSFTLTPTNPTDDLDFAVYELPNGIDNCNGKILLRCMASGENIGQPFAQWEPCTGPTGLSEGSNDNEEFPGCGPNDDNFVAALDMEAGRSYALIVNNFSNTGNGFSIEFGGTGTFLGPEPDISVEPPEGTQCDIDEVTIINNSTLPPGITGTYEWYFGEGSFPTTANGPGPHDISYSSFGNKSIVLRIETDQGCIVTEVRNLFIEPCCDPATDLGINLEDAIDPICFGDSTGYIEVSGENGTPAYEFSLDGMSFQPFGQFGNVPSGSFTLYVQDIKGCQDSLDVSLFDPPELIVDAGEDQEINLGESTQLDATYFPQSYVLIDTVWTNSSTLSCTDCFDPGAMPVVPTVYYLTITNEEGCEAVDSVYIFVDPIRPVYIPNAITPNFDGVNDYFTAYGGAAAELIEELLIFDRWGGLLYRADNIPLNDDLQGWDGTSGGRPAGSGVYVFLIKIRFLDGFVGVYSGDINLIR
jgi:gliding motility-associated-like protein